VALDDKASNKAEELTGKEIVDHATGNTNMKAEGKGDQAKGNLSRPGRRSTTSPSTDHLSHQW
jgi:hypothetical protein